MQHLKRSSAPADDRIGVIYARYSSHSQRDESIEQQVEECMAFAARNGIKIIDVYPDKAISGKTDRRPYFQKMMRDAEKRKFDVVVAYKSNRIARNMLHALQYEDRLSSLGIETVYAKEEFGNSAAGRFALRTMMNVNQFYSENMSEDIKRGLQDNARDCKVNGPLPYGYRAAPDHSIEIEPDEASIIREIFDSVLCDVSIPEIAQRLNERHVKTRRGNAWKYNSFHRLLRNNSYIGVYHHSGIVVEGGIPPILSKEVFFAVQDKLDKDKQPARRMSASYLLTGKLICGYCSTAMVGVSGTGKSGDLHYYYQCRTRRSGGGCHKEHVRRDWIEETVARLTQTYILRDDVIEWIADSAMQYQSELRKEAGADRLKSELADNRKARKNIMDAIEQGVFTATTKDRLLELEAEASELEKMIASASACDRAFSRERIVFSLQRLRGGDVTSKAYQRQLIDTFVKSVYLYDDSVRIEYYSTSGPHCFSYPIDADTPDPDVRTDSDMVHHRRTIRTPYGVGEVLITATGFVLFCPLSDC